MKERPKAVVIDLDGTLLHSDGTISERTLTALRRCRENGILIIIATARFWFRARKLIDAIAPDYAVLADGTQIYRNEKLTLGFPMDSCSSREIIRELQTKPDNDFVVSTGKLLLCSRPGTDEPWRKSFNFENAVSGPVYKIAAIIDSAEEAKMLAQRYGYRLYSYRGENLYGFTEASAGKFQSVMALSEQLDIALQDMLAFGDDENDYEMLKYCGTGIAMNNAIASIKEAADHVTVSNDEDGVAVYLEQFVL